MIETLRYMGREFINFRDFDFEPGSSHHFRWVDIKNFQLHNIEADDETVLHALTLATEFRDDYVGGGVDPNGAVHGPYLLDYVSADAFTSMNAAMLLNTFHKWLSRCGILPSQLRKVLHDKIIDPIETATSRFELAYLGEHAKNDYADLHNEFHEFVLINRTAGNVTLVVATDD